MNDLNAEKKWNVNDRDAWDALYQRSIAVYWYKYETNKNKPVSLYDVYSEMGVSNVTKNLADNTGVIFSSRDGEREIVKVNLYHSSHALSNDPEYTPKGWMGLRGKLTIKIPNRLLLPDTMVKWFEDIKLDGLDALLNETLSENYCFFKNENKKVTVKDFMGGTKLPYAGKANSSTVGIPELLVLLGVIDKCIKQHGAPKDVMNSFKQADGHVSNSLTILLSQWQSLGRFFPFGFVMSQEDGWIRPPYAFPEQYDDWTLQSATDGDEASANKTDKYGISQVATDIYGNSQNTVASYSGSHSEADNAGMNNRGGSQGLDDDYNWEHFAPEMVACNWQFLRALKGGIKNGSSLRDYQTMLHILDYKIPRFAEIFIELEDALPWGIVKHEANAKHSENKAEWNYKAYTTTLLVEYPKPPAPSNRPMAMCDLIADRANEPFTCF